MKIVHLYFYYSKQRRGAKVLEELEKIFGSKVSAHPSVLPYPTLDIVGESGKVEKSFFGENEIKKFAASQQK